MQTINLKQLLDDKGLKYEFVGQKLFPRNRYPYLAIKRVMDGKAVLDADQISLLSQITGVPIGLLFEGGNWRGSQKGDIITFTSDKYTAELDVRNWETRVYENGTLFHEVLIHGGGITLSAYLKHLTNIVINKNK